MKKLLFLIKTEGKTEAEIARDAGRELAKKGIWEEKEIEELEKSISEEGLWQK